MFPGWWAANLDAWFDKRRENLRAGTEQPLPASKWLRKMRADKRFGRLKKSLENIADLILKDMGL